jgi:GT2 family glycosyltransferase
MLTLCNVTAIVPACTRVLELLRCLAAIKSCEPCPAEIIVYVDGGDQRVGDAVAERHPDVRVILGEGFIGPGGARNRLVEEATHELVANFDDDSFPDHADYFARVVHGFEVFSDMAVLSAASQPCEMEMPGYMQVGIFSGCGCVFSKRWFSKTTGHVPLRVAYCMEEVDLSLRLNAIGGMIVHDPGLRVCHLRNAAPSLDAESNARVLANVALMAFLRYPLVLFPLGVWNVIRRIVFLIQKGWLAGIGSGLLLIPYYFVAYRGYREPVALRSIISWFKLRRTPVLL